MTAVREADFIAAAELVTTVVNALESSEISQESIELLRQIYSLKIALLQVKSLSIADSQHSEFVSLCQAASQCEQTIDAFWQKIQKYQPHLQPNGSSSLEKNSWAKIKWTICKKYDIAKFKADLAANTESILLLLAVVQKEDVNIAKDTQERHSYALRSKSEKECSHSGDINVDCLTKFCRMEDGKPNIDDLKAETSLHLTGPAEPRRRSARLLDLVQQFGKVSPPLKPEPAPSTASTDNLSTGLSSESDETDDVNRLSQRQEDALLSHPSPVSNGKRVRLWQCCNCGEAGQTCQE
ncbi:hypothetical protein O988_00588 [Pseudogymnoascus sp. VKM F-3808]|nr:hypothetical protein O988_00588 [Pseudogymnoascus sp. VKM F-3808]